ncbi:uncharacterized protein TRAVEDRAFT_82237, partial [Trametes versicolor FP-101664 SS1]|uniref:uncharacterized protein n=1 Tax=Trametes versicolor (strain FP-101664) TaxID=717944 RepID=UPI000462397E
ICQAISAECFEKTKKRIDLPKSTVIARANGRRSIRAFNAEKRWLTDGEEEVVVEFTIDTALRGFPLSHQRLKEHVDSICKARLGNEFPTGGIGKEWTYRFVERHSDRL